VPNDPAGNYSLPPSYRAEAGTTIRTEQHNPPLEDLAQAMSGRLMRDGRNGMVGALDMGGFPVRNVQPGTLPTDALAVSQGLPVGTIIDFAGDTPPAGWILCTGGAISRADFADLFAVIGTRFGAPTSTTFQVPDCRGRVRAGRDNMGGASANRLSLFASFASVIGGAFGFDRHQLTAFEMPGHTHGVTDPGHSHGYADQGIDENLSGLENGAGTGWRDYGRVSNAAGTGISIQATGGNQTHNNVQPTIIFNTIIKATY
jgi:microcystin-dependent protein